MDVYETCRDKVLMARHMHKNVLAQGRIQGEGGVPFFKKLL